MALPETWQQEVDAQVKAGMCRRGETATGCLLDDGTEVACQTIRECMPSQHFEYALPGSSPNKNIWVWGTNGFEWSGLSSQTPVYQPGIGIDPFSGAPNPMVDYNLIPYVPPQSYGPGSNGTPPAGQPTYTGDRSSGGNPVAPSYSITDIAGAARNLYGRTAITQAEFCVLYLRLTNYACDFDAAEAGVKEATDWLAQLQTQQNKRVSVIGNNPLPGSQGTIPPKTTTGGGTGTGSVSGNSGNNNNNNNNNMMMMLLLVVLLVLFLKD